MHDCTHVAGHTPDAPLDRWCEIGPGGTVRQDGARRRRRCGHRPR